MKNVWPGTRRGGGPRQETPLPPGGWPRVGEAPPLPWFRWLPCVCRRASVPADCLSVQSWVPPGLDGNPLNPMGKGQGFWIRVGGVGGCLIHIVALALHVNAAFSKHVFLLHFAFICQIEDAVGVSIFFDFPCHKCKFELAQNLAQTAQKCIKEGYSLFCCCHCLTAPFCRRAMLLTPPPQVPTPDSWDILHALDKGRWGVSSVFGVTWNGPCDMENARCAKMRPEPPFTIFPDLANFANFWALCFFCF